MADLRKQIIKAIKEGNDLKYIYEASLGDEDKREKISRELIKIHNEGVIDVVAIFKKLRNQSNPKHDFFLTRHIFEKILPELDSPVLAVMGCVIHLVKEAGEDMAAGMLFPPFTTYCQTNEDRPITVLNLAVEQYENWKDFISPAIIAGTRINLSDYVDKAIALTTEQNIEISSRAVFALGRINYNDNFDIVEKVLKSLQLAIQGEYNDQLFGALLKTSYSLYLADHGKEQAVSDLIDTALARRGDLTLYSASELFMFEKNTLPDSIVDLLLKAFENVDFKHVRTLNNIDFGLDNLVKKGQGKKAVNLLEILLIKHGSNFSISQFDSLGRGLLKNQDNILDKTITRWLMSGVVRLGRSASDLINDFGEKNTVISVDEEQLKAELDNIHLFLTKKACGWFFFNPVCAASFILSLIDIASDDEVNSISEILFNPLLISYSGGIKEYLQSLPDDSSEKVKGVIDKLLSDLDDYHNGLKSIKDLKELEPSIAQREAYHRKMNREISGSYKDAQKKSIFGQIFGKPSVLLYGNSSIHYVHHGPDGEKSRQVIPLQNINTSFEFPSLENLDPHGLKIKLRNFKLEGCSS